MELRQITVYEHFGCVNICAPTFLFMDQSAPCRLENFGEDIPTSPDVIEAHTLNFKPNFKFTRIFFWGFFCSFQKNIGFFPFGDGLGSMGQSVTRVKI